MRIQKCKNCRTEFKYKNLLKASLSSNVLDCRNCGGLHRMTLGSRFVISLLISLPAFIAIFPVSIKNSIRSALPNLVSVYLVCLVYVIMIVALSPFICRYKPKDSNE